MIEAREFDATALRVAHSVEVDPLRGSATVQVPLRLPPGRDGMGPALALVHGGGSAPSLFGDGWSLAGLPFIGRDLRAGLPSRAGSDRYATSAGTPLVHVRTREASAHQVHVYIEHVESGAERYERWVHRESGEVHWRVWAPDGSVSLFGLAHRIADPDDPHHVWKWLLERVVDEQGNAMVVEYQAEDGAGLPPVEAARAQPQRYPSAIRYGNTRPVALEGEPDTDWRFLVLFDYGDHADEDGELHVTPVGAWPVRLDPFRTGKPGFVLTTWRLCRRILVVHDFPELSGAQLVGVHTLEHEEGAASSRLTSIRYEGRRGTERVSLPALELAYAESETERAFEATTLPRGLRDARWVDLEGEGLPGLLYERAGAWYFQEGLGGGQFARRASSSAFRTGSRPPTASETSTPTATPTWCTPTPGTTAATTTTATGPAGSPSPPIGGRPGPASAPPAPSGSTWTPTAWWTWSSTTATGWSGIRRRGPMASARRGCC